MIPMNTSIEARLLADYLVTVPIGGTASYDDLSKVIERDIRQCRYFLKPAFELAQNEGALFRGARLVGYRRVQLNSGISDALSVGIQKAKRAMKRGEKSAKRVMPYANDLSAEEQRKIGARLSVIGMVQHLTREKTMSAITVEDSKPLSVAATGKAFLKNIGAI
jgi:hypothetical protein